MSLPSTPPLEPGRVYRTRDLARWSGNAARLAKRLVRDGQLLRLGHGLFTHTHPGCFGPASPQDEDLMRAFLDGSPFVFTGPEKWNALGLGTTAVSASMLVYNTKRSGTFEFPQRSFQLRRVAFPDPPPLEWFVIDLLEHAEQVAASLSDRAGALTSALIRRDFSPDELTKMASLYGTKTTRSVIKSALMAAA